MDVRGRAGIPKRQAGAKTRKNKGEGGVEREYGKGDGRRKETEIRLTFLLFQGKRICFRPQDSACLEVMWPSLDICGKLAPAMAGVPNF